MRDVIPAGEGDWAVSPGEVLAELIEERGIDLPALIAKTGLTGEDIEHILHATGSITPDVAARLETGIGPPARLWLKLQDGYDRAVSRMRENDSGADCGAGEEM
jgi:HTH-type transcriptional regulator/antitoxin HigA